MADLLQVTDLSIRDSFGNLLVADSAFRIREGSCLAIVGESGSGKSLTCKAVMGLLPSGLHRTGDVLFRGRNLAALPKEEMRKLRGKRICMIAQNGMRAFDPSRRIGAQMTEILALHLDAGRADILSKLRLAMESVRLKDPSELMARYPYQLSGGMLQRLMIAQSIALEPDLVVADEPTSALDTVSRHEVMEQFVRLRERSGCAMLFVSHDLDAVAKLADEAMVMKRGQVVESGPPSSLLTSPRHAYTRELFGARRTLLRNFDRMMEGVNHVER